MKGSLSNPSRFPGTTESDREHMLQLVPQKVGEPLDRGRVRDSIRALYATGRFADIQAGSRALGRWSCARFHDLS